nr:PadR family transcriptional regulator [Candidatus Sigynarchaeota archaeon]
MIKRVKEFGPAAMITKDEYRLYAENFESEILRGINTLIILRVIQQCGTDGSYGYQILKDLEEHTKKLLVIEEGTLYPILRKLEKDHILESMRKEVGGRERKYYKLTPEGVKVYNHMLGFMTKLVESIAPLTDMKVVLDRRYYYCPNCANKIDLSAEGVKFCDVCGLNVEQYKQEVEKHE